MKTEDLDVLMAEAKKLGASAVKVVDVKTIKRGMWPRMKCQFGCSQYGKSLCCPPYIPSIQEMEKFLSEYSTGLLVRMTFPCTAEDFKNWQAIDIRSTNELLHLLVRIERAAMMKNYYKAFALKAGKCRLCPTCNLKHCVHPEEARPSLEACGIDVFALAADNGFDTKMYTGPITEFSVYGMVLIE